MPVPEFISDLRLLLLQRSWGANAAPVFIVGAPRTGSSFLNSALIGGAGFSGSAEGHVTPLMMSLDRIVHGYYAHVRGMGMLDIPENTVTKIPEAELARELVEVFNRFHRRIFHRGSRLLDKTVNVEAIEALPYLLSVWPRARVIYLTRDGIDNVISAQKYFGVTLEIAARNWAACGRAWDRVVPKLAAHSHITVSQNQLTANPLEVASRVAEHLGLADWRRTRFLRYVMRYTPTWRAERAERPPLHQLPWSKEDRFTFLSICGAQMIAQGYASAAEIDPALAEVRPDSVSLGADLVRVLAIDNPDFFKPLDDGFLAVPGRDSACVLSFDHIETQGKRTLVGSFAAIDPDAQGVRVEVMVISSSNGALLGHQSVEIATLASQNVRIEFSDPAEQVDVMLRLTIGHDAASNDSAWVNFSGIALI